MYPYLSNATEEHFRDHLVLAGRGLGSRTTHIAEGNKMSIEKTGTEETQHTKMNKGKEKLCLRD